MTPTSIKKSNFKKKMQTNKREKERGEKENNKVTRRHSNNHLFEFSLALVVSV